MPIDNTTTIGIGLVFTLMGAAGSFGVMWNRLSNAEKKHDEDEKRQIERDKQVREDMRRLEQKIDVVLEILADTGLKKS